MDLIEKFNTLLNATVRSAMSPRERRSALEQLEQEQLEAIRQALAQVELREREAAERVKSEQSQAEAAAQRGDTTEQRAHERRAAELERHLQGESIQAINLEEKLRALEEKLALAKEAVDKETRKAAARDEAASQVLARTQSSSTITQTVKSPPATTEVKPQFTGDDSALAARKSRLSD
jgi:hypothetical protein